MNLSKKISFLFAACFLFNLSIAQQAKKANLKNEYRAVHWGIENGLSQDEVYDMIKDVNGFMWIGTGQGLSRFDGSTFRNFYYRPGKRESIAGNLVMGLVEDSLHNIWIGTENGLSRYDTKADTFRNIPSVIRGKAIIPFWATKDEVLCWDYSESQLSAYNINSFVKRDLVKITTADTVGYSITDQYVIFDVGSNSVWMVKGIPGWAGGKLGGLLQISLSDGKREEFTWPCFKGIPEHSHFTQGMRYDQKRNSIWMSSTDGLIEFTLNDKKFHHIQALNEFVNVKDFMNWAGIDLDSRGRVWMGTAPAGIIIYDSANNSAQLAFPADSGMQKNVSEANVSIYCDRDGIVWSGSWDRRGIYQMIPFSKSVEHYKADIGKQHGLSTNSIINCISADKGRIWMGTEDGLNVFDPKTQLFEILRAKDLPGFKGNVIIPMVVDTLLMKAWVFGAPPRAVFEMDLNTRQCRPLIFKDTGNNRIPAQDIIFPKAKAYRNRCIISADFGDQQGIFIVSGDSAVAQQVLSLPRGTFVFNSLTNDDQSIFLKGVGTNFNLTYTNHNGKWIRTPSPLDSIQWSTIVYNKADQTYWVAADEQLIRYNKEFRVTRRYTEGDGFPGIEIYDLIPDDRGNIWFHTDRSIAGLNIKTGKITTLSEKDGFQKQDFSPTSPGTKDDYGDLYFPGGLPYGEGFVRVSPDKFLETYPPSSVYVRSIEVNQNSALPTTGINNLEELSLRYFQNKITIETGIIDYYSKGKGSIRYKLEGLNENWQYAPAYYTIRYDGLAARKYKLKIQASNAANEFSGPVKILLISISPAFWNTWWFRIAAIVCLVALVYALMRWRLQQKFRFQLERSEKEKQFSDLKQKTVELEMQALRAQMNPHFIFNSLNSINRFILQNNKVQASEYLTKFSKLVRLILQNSQAALIPLESELESLELYLDLEAVRFDHRFGYKITVPKDLDIDVLKVPPLVIQPYAENAIWHELMHKEEKGHLDIEVTQENDHLFFKIADDGIGRKASAALASKSATKHKSMGLKITSDRIAMLQDSNGKGSPVSFNDLVNPDGSAAGTEVIIKIPVLYD